LHRHITNYFQSQTNRPTTSRSILPPPTPLVPRSSPPSSPINDNRPYCVYTHLLDFPPTASTTTHPVPYLTQPSNFPAQFQLNHDDFPPLLRPSQESTPPLIPVTPPRQQHIPIPLRPVLRRLGRPTSNEINTISSSSTTYTVQSPNADISDGPPPLIILSPSRPRNLFLFPLPHNRHIPTETPNFQTHALISVLNPLAAPFIPAPSSPEIPVEIHISSQQRLAQRWRTLFNYSHDYRLEFHQPTRQAAFLSETNLSNNNPWGDDMICPKGKEIFRLYSQNINGLKLDNCGGDLQPIADFINEYQCDIIGFSETNVDVSKYAVKKIITDTLNKEFDAHHSSISTSEIPFNSFYKPGGTMTAIFNHSTSRYHIKFADPMGRWSTLSLTGRRGRINHFITVYQLVDKAVTGPFTSYQQQLSSLILHDRTQTPRQALIADFRKYLTTLTTGNYALVVMGDLNEVVGLQLSGFGRIVNDFELVNVMSHYHPIEQEVTTYARGTTRLDYIFCMLKPEFPHREPGYTDGPRTVPFTSTDPLSTRSAGQRRDHRLVAPSSH
jgi:hypothetical protein